MLLPPVSRLQTIGCECGEAGCKGRCKQEEEKGGPRDNDIAQGIAKSVCCECLGESEHKMEYLCDMLLLLQASSCE